MDYTVEEVQAFGSTPTPSPPWVIVIPVSITSDVCALAAKVLIEHFGPAEIEHVVGGTQWWQRRARKDGGIEAEWIAMRKDWNKEKLDEFSKRTKNKKQRTEDLDLNSQDYFRSRETTPHNTTTQEKAAAEESAQDIADLNESPRTMLYIHGGAYYFGSINTHRYQLWRHARKMGGRVFALRYRLSPQYPFPCALHDALAAYLFLIRPPVGAAYVFSICWYRL